MLLWYRGMPQFWCMCSYLKEPDGAQSCMLSSADDVVATSFWNSFYLWWAEVHGLPDTEHPGVAKV